MTACTEFCSSRRIQRTAAYKVQRPVGQKIANGEFGSGTVRCLAAMNGCSAAIAVIDPTPVNWRYRQLRPLAGAAQSARKRTFASARDIAVVGERAVAAPEGRLSSSSSGVRSSGPFPPRTGLALSYSRRTRSSSTGPGRSATLMRTDASTEMPPPCLHCARGRVLRRQ
jgi:hypothetical protein